MSGICQAIQMASSSSSASATNDISQALEHDSSSLALALATNALNISQALEDDSSSSASSAHSNPAHAGLSDSSPELNLIHDFTMAPSSSSSSSSSDLSPSVVEACCYNTVWTPTLCKPDTSDRPLLFFFQPT
jgi:hypothetical protein